MHKLDKNQKVSTSSQAAESIIRVLSQSTRDRLAIFSKIFIWCFITGFVLSLSMPFFLDKDRKIILVMSLLCLIMTIFSVIVYLAAKSINISAERLLMIGSAYVIGGCLAMSTAEVSLLQEGMRDKEGLSGMCIWLVMFPLIIPIKPKRSLITALIAASMLPLCYFIGITFFTVPEMRTTFLVDWFSGLYFCAGLSYAASLCVYEWGSEIAKAKNDLKKLGSYQLIEVIGEGGMGVVWKAKHRSLAREAAIKLIHRTEIEEKKLDEIQSSLSLFEKEAQATALLKSPHTISLYDFGVTDEGDMYYAMELLDGPDLDYLVDNFGPQPAGRVAQILTQACLSLEEAHKKEMLHLDIKPSNLMICQMGRQADFVKILDFGLVKLFREARAKSPYEAITGTSAFIAPESILLRQQTPATDIYSLGCVAYWLLTGTTVFANDAMEQDFASHVKEKVEYPSIRLGKKLPENLEAIIMMCLEKNPKRRFQSAAHLRQTILRCACHNEWTDEEASKWWTAYENHKATKKLSASSWGNPRMLSVGV